MTEYEKTEYGTALLLALLKKMVKVEFEGPEMVIWTDDNKKFHIVGYQIKKEESENGNNKETTDK